MAEFKLGRIRFVWKGDWTSSTTYYQDDVIALGGKIYICVVGHESQSSFFSDFDITPPKWNLVSDGQTWKGEWQTSTEYIYDDIVSYGARLYIANTNHTSAADAADGLEDDQSNWDLYAEGLDWKGDWTVSTRYRINDLVKYGGHTYVCNTLHTSAATEALGLEDDQANWDYFNQGIEYKSTWAGSTRYKINDVVRYGASLWICTEEHTSDATSFGTNADKFEKFVEGFQYEAEWNYEAEYQPGDIVQYGGNQYIAKTDNSDSIPPSNEADWDLFSEGFKFLGEWGEDSTGYEYKIGELVSHGGYTYVCIEDHTSQQPPNILYWKRLNTGLRWRGEWLDDQEYLLGDIVRYSDNSYVCVQGHISEGDDFSTETLVQPGGGAENSRPDLDTNGTYWHIIAVGTEQSVLTTSGDMVYYSGSAPTRLPIGLNGQVLTVNQNQIPEWAFVGSTEDVYYVAEHGVDEPAPVYGQSIDRPWKTIRYAAEQVERGAKNPAAARLLEMNRRFIQREIVEWTDKQIVDGTSPFTTDFNYESVKCERDMGLIVDALIWDITHGGNVKSREAALAYVNDTAGSPYLNQKDETVASINYGLEVIEAVLNQSAPTVNYQDTNGDNSTAVVEQWFDDTLTAETTVLARATELVQIITDAITAGVDTDIPARLINTTLIRVSTGRYKEVLPIIVPAECCIMGDELRATNVQPRTPTNSTLTPKNDFRYSYKALERMEAVIGDIVTGNAVSKTTGNNEVQSQEWPYAETTVVAPQVEKLSRMIRRQIDDKLELRVGTTFENAWDMATPANGRSRDLFIANKEFIQAEIIAYIADQYPNLKYSRTKCRRDTGLIMDSVAYDLTYGGNWASVEAGKAYFNGRTGDLQIDSTEKTATIAAYGYLKELMQTTGRGITVSPLYQTDVAQLTGTAGDAGASTIIGNVMDDLITVIQDGYDNAPTITYPSYTDADIDTMKAALDADLTSIQEQTIDFINKNFGSLTYDSAKHRTDINNITTDIAYDVALGTNYNAIFNGIAHNRPTGAYGIINSRTETVGSIRNTRDLVIDELSDSTAISRTTTAYNEIVDIINNGNGAADVYSYPSPATLPTTNAQDAFDNLEANKDFIIAEITAWIADQSGGIWSGFTYDSTKCERDVGYIVEAMKYDILYGGTMATTRIAESYFGYDGTAYPAGQTAQTSAAYDRLSVVLDEIAREQTVTTSSTNLETQTTLGTPATATEGNALIAKMTIITDVLDAGNTNSLPAVVYPDLSALAVSATLQTEKSAIDTARAQIILDTIQFITTEYDSFKYDHTKCSRDVGLILDAAIYDYAHGTNFQSIFAGQSYLRAPSANVLSDQKEASVAAFEYAKTQFKTVVSGSGAAAGKITGLNTQIDNTWEWVDDYIINGSAEGSNSQVEDIEVYNAIRQLEMNKDFIAAEVQAHVDNYFTDTVFETDSATNQFTVASTAWMRENMEIRFVNPEDSTDSIANAGLDPSITYFVKSIVDSTHFTISLFAEGPTTAIQSHDEPFTVESTYSYDPDTCTRDVKAYIDAIKWDLTWPYSWKREYTDSITFYRPGSYKTRLAARYYINSVIGSHEEDFYYLRNGTGLRLQTLDGLNGDLTPENAYGTSRVTAGAYASLDPGWGPEDRRVWITARSPYVQNCTTFGYAATGQKIDGALHNGGNDSIVSNDFTQVISDGIGAHILNNGRAELVSVFTYYSHIGYLAESGGRIRATNGNNSYGTWGSVAEGVDPEETEVSGVVDNRTQYSATVGNVNTDNDQISSFEFSHAGNDYTEVSYDIFGAGSGEIVLGDEFRDDAVYRVRVEEINDSSGKAGGSGYLVVGNTAQTGNDTGIFLAATDGNISTAYPGMKIYITGGAGIGQYGIIDTYNAGSKEATVIRESDGLDGWDHIIPGTPWVTPNSTSVYQIEPRIVFSDSAKSNSTITLPTSASYADVKFIETSAEYVGLATTTDSDGSGATFDVIRNGSKYYLTINNGGTGYSRLDTVIIAGTSVDGIALTNDITVTITTVNTSGTVVDFDFDGIGLAGKFLAVGGTTTGAVSVDGTNWTAETLPTAGSGTWSRVASGLQDDGSSTYKASAVVAVCDGSSNVAYGADADTWNTTTLPAGMNTGAETRIAYGNVVGSIANRFVVVSSADRDVAYSDDGGQNWTLTTDALSAVGFDSVAYGAGVFVATASGTTSAAWSNNGIVWNDVTLPGNAGADVVFGNGRFVALGGTNGVMYSLDGKTWYDPERSEGTALTLNLTATERRIAYGQGMFVITSDDTDQVEYSEDGQVWTAYTLGSAITGGLNAVAFGNPQRVGKFVAIMNNSGTSGHEMRIGARAKGRAAVANEQIFEVRLSEPGSCYTSEPTITVTDPNNINDVILSVRTGKGALANPTFINRGSSYTTSSAEVNANASNGVADFYQDGQFVAVRRLTTRPVPGSNVVFGGLPGQYFKLVNVVSFVGTNDGSYTAFLQLSPNMTIEDAPEDGESVEMRIRFSQVRLTGHDFLDIGTGNFVDTNYPGIPVNDPDQAHETNEANGGRVFYTATDQDGNFRVGDLFSVEQATGVATLNADAFNIAGLQELTLGEVTLGGNSASITEFSTDPFMTANSDSIVPTQRAVKAYIEAQIGGGGASLVVNSVTAGDIYIGSNLITTVSGSPINIKANIVFSGTVLGLPLAYNYFLRT